MSGGITNLDVSFFELFVLPMEQLCDQSIWILVFALQVSHWKLMKSTTFLRIRLFLSASWIQGAKQVPKLWSQKKANKRSVKMFASPSAFVPSAPLPLKIIWRSFLGHRWMCYHRHHHSWPYVEVFFTFGKCSLAIPLWTIWWTWVFGIWTMKHLSFWRRCFWEISIVHCIFVHYLL